MIKHSTHARDYTLLTVLDTSIEQKRVIHKNHLFTLYENKHSVKDSEQYYSFFGAGSEALSAAFVSKSSIFPVSRSTFFPKTLQGTRVLHPYVALHTRASSNTFLNARAVSWSLNRIA